MLYFFAEMDSETVQLMALHKLCFSLYFVGAIEDLFDENEDVGKKASSSGVEFSTSKD